MPDMGIELIESQYLTHSRACISTVPVSCKLLVMEHITGCKSSDTRIVIIPSTILLSWDSRMLIIPVRYHYSWTFCVDVMGDRSDHDDVTCS